MNTQIQQVLKQLIKKGKVSRNWALDRRITRLGAIINHLIVLGWRFKEHRAGKEILRGRYERTKNGKDYVYYLDKS